MVVLVRAYLGPLPASSGSTANNYLYTGEPYDPNLGFYPDEDWGQTELYVTLD